MTKQKPICFFCFRGPQDTCFEGGVFPAVLSFPSDYPLSPPKMRFTCEMFHPNSEFLLSQILVYLMNLNYVNRYACCEVECWFLFKTWSECLYWSEIRQHKSFIKCMNHAARWTCLCLHMWQKWCQQVCPESHYLTGCWLVISKLSMALITGLLPKPWCRRRTWSEPARC